MEKKKEGKGFSGGRRLETKRDKTDERIGMEVENLKKDIKQK